MVDADQPCLEVGEYEMEPLSEGFRHFVTSMPAPVASGWSDRRVGLAPTGKRRLFTAHTLSGALPGLFVILCQARRAL